MAIDYTQKVAEGARRLAQMGRNTDGLKDLKTISKAFAMVEIPAHVLHGTLKGAMGAVRLSQGRSRNGAS